MLSARVFSRFPVLLRSLGRITGANHWCEMCVVRYHIDNNIDNGYNRRRVPPTTWKNYRGALVIVYAVLGRRVAERRGTRTK